MWSVNRSMEVREGGSLLGSLAPGLALACLVIQFVGLLGRSASSYALSVS